MSGQDEESPLGCRKGPGNRVVNKQAVNYPNALYRRRLRSHHAYVPLYTASAELKAWISVLHAPRCIKAVDIEPTQLAWTNSYHWTNSVFRLPILLLYTLFNNTPRNHPSVWDALIRIQICCFTPLVSPFQTLSKNAILTVPPGEHS